MWMEYIPQFEIQFLQAIPHEKEIRKILCDPEFSQHSLQKMINQKKWNQANMTETSKKIRNWSVPLLAIRYLEQMEISQAIFLLKDISFYGLTRLDLTSTRLQEISTLIQLNAPKLRIISLSHNQIVAMVTFRKANFPNLSTIQLYNNRCVCMQWTSLLTSEVQFIELEHYNDRCQSQDMGWLAKVFGNKLKKITISNKRRIRQRKTKEIVRNRITGIIIYTPFD